MTYGPIISELLQCILHLHLCGALSNSVKTYFNQLFLDPHSHHCNGCRGGSWWKGVQPLFIYPTKFPTKLQPPLGLPYRFSLPKSLTYCCRKLWNSCSQKVTRTMFFSFIFVYIMAACRLSPKKFGICTFSLQLPIRYSCTVLVTLIVVISPPLSSLSEIRAASVIPFLRL